MIFGACYSDMIDVRIFIDTLPRETSSSLILNFMEALLWYQIYHIEWNIQRVRRNFLNNRLIMKIYEIIADVEAQWSLSIPKFTIKYPWITPFLDKIRHSLKVLPVLKETLKRIENGGKWFVVSGRTPTNYHKPEYVELVYKIHSIEYLIWMLENLINIEKEEANRIQENIKLQHHKHFKPKVHFQKHHDNETEQIMNIRVVHDDQVKDKSITSINDEKIGVDESKSSSHKHHRTNSGNEAPSPIEVISNVSSETGNEINSLSQALPTIEPVAQDESLYPPGNIRVSTVLSPHIDMIIDELIKEINWCGDELDERKEEKSIQAGLNILARIDPWRYSTSVKQKHGRIDMLSVDEKNELMKRLADATNYLIEMFPDNDIIGFE